MQLHVQVTEADYLRFNEYHLKNAKTNRWAMNVLRYCLPVISVGMIALDWKNGPGNVLMEAIIMGVLSVLWVWKMPAVMKKLSAMGIRQMKKQGGKLPYHEQSDFEFTEDKVIETTSNSVFRVKYADMTQAAWNGDDLYLYLNAMQAFILPGVGAEHRAELDKLLTGVGQK